MWGRCNKQHGGRFIFQGEEVDEGAALAVNFNLAATDQLGQRRETPINIVDAKLDKRQAAVLRFVRLSDR